MLDEDENPVECTECIQRTCLQASALTETTRIVPANEESILVWVTRTRRKIEGWEGRSWERWVRERGRTAGREKRVAAGDREEETSWTARRSRRSYNALRSASIKSVSRAGFSRWTNHPVAIYTSYDFRSSFAVTNFSHVIPRRKTG